jgi:hypothetical protein
MRNAFFVGSYHCSFSAYCEKGWFLMANGTLIAAQEQEENSRLLDFVLDAFNGNQAKEHASTVAYEQTTRQLSAIFDQAHSPEEANSALSRVLATIGHSFW